ncbi:MAG: hypothetical protein ACPLRM_01695, partial [Anaerolineae bacterium]
ATEFVTTHLQPGNYYRFCVQAVYDGRESAWSSETTYWVASQPSLAAGYDRMTVSWPKVMNNLTYRVWWRLEGGSWNGPYSTTSLSYTISGLSPGQKYEFALSPYLDEGGTDWKQVVGPKSPLPYKPGTPYFGTATVDSIQVYWANNGNPSGVKYELRRNGSLVYSGTSTSYLDTGLAPGTAYTYDVRAVAADGTPSEYSSTASKKTLCAPPEGLTAETGVFGWDPAAGRGWVKLTWQPSQGATGYRLWVFDGYAYRSFDLGNVTSWDSRNGKIYPAESYLDGYSDNSINWDVFRKDGTGLDLRDTPNKLYRKTSGTTYDTAHNYWFRVSALNESGDSAQSAAVTPTLSNRTDTAAPQITSMLLNAGQSIAGGSTVPVLLTA